MKNLYEVEYKHTKHFGESNVTFTVRAKTALGAIMKADKILPRMEFEDRVVCVRVEFLAVLDN